MAEVTEDHVCLVRRMARRYWWRDLSDREDAEGAALLAVQKASGSHDPKRGPFVVLATIAARHALGVARADLVERSSERPLFLEGPDGEDLERPEMSVEDDPADRLVSDQMAQMVRNAVMGLPGRDREVVIRRFWGGESLERIGADLDLSKQRVGQLEARALQRLRRALG